MKTSNKILIAAILLVVIPAITTLLSVISRTNQTIEMINSINIDSISVVDARNTNLALAPNEDAFSRMGVIWIENGSDEDNIVQIKGDTLVVGKQVTRLCVPNAKQLLLPDGVIDNPFYDKGKGKFTLYTIPEQ